MSTSVEKDVVRRPGGRTADITGRVHAAVIELVLEGGLEACTFSSVAERAGIERSTLYRRYPDRLELMIDTWMARGEEVIVPVLGHSFAADLRSVLRKIVALLETPLGPALLTFAAELRARSGSDYPRTFFDRRMEQLAPMFDAAIARGELDPDVDREALFSFAAGPLYFRMFIAARRTDDAFIDRIVDNICRLYCVQ
ncbi:MAG TPA: TetR/AcrR family transcriptional regulator C-terminal ligand-binding domain-containing protein [Sphingomicrobium sp.]|jgi:AcrR family transcriptional regulator|nr:TetR/AcrR family transcriptional regulator C-terminal ligand-binding domain-containing protein [Sphingomicrobium sp.]